MHIILLKFSDNKGAAGEHMEAHKNWLQQGFDEGVFMLAGSLGDNQGGGIIAKADSLESLAERVNLDPFVSENVVRPEIIEMNPSRANPQLEFLLQ